MFEELTGETIDLSADGAFSPIRTVREEDVIDHSLPESRLADLRQRPVDVLALRAA